MYGSNKASKYVRLMDWLKLNANGQEFKLDEVMNILNYVKNEV